MIKGEKGQIWPKEWKHFKDRKTGVNITQLTNYMGHSHHLYFTHNGWYDQNLKLLFGSDRDNRSNLYSIDLITGDITQLTDLKPNSHPIDLLGACINQIRNEVYFWYNRKIVSLDLVSLQEREIYELPEGFVGGNISSTADGESICFSIHEDLSHQIEIDYLHGYVGFEETWDLHPLSKIIRVSVTSNESCVLHEDRIWIAQVNTSPTQPHLLSFCHEGPWDLVDHRIWILDMNTMKSWKICIPKETDEFVGHEYWHADGIHIGYHGFRGSLESTQEKFLGRIRYDNKERQDIRFPYQNVHIHSNDFNMIVGDGQQASAYHGDRSRASIRLWKRNGDVLEGPRILCVHRGSFQIQKLHVHPRISPSHQKVLFTSDMSGYGNLYLADIPDFESLPEIVGLE